MIAKKRQLFFSFHPSTCLVRLDCICVLMPCWPKDTEGFAFGSNADYDMLSCCLVRWREALHECKRYV